MLIATIRKSTEMKHSQDFQKHHFETFNDLVDLNRHGKEIAQKAKGMKIFKKKSLFFPILFFFCI